MKRVHPHRTGLTFGSFLAACHFAWSLLVASGAAQPVIDLIFRLHMIKPPYQIDEFRLTTAISLVIVTAAIGYAIGFIFGLLWNRFAPYGTEV